MYTINGKEYSVFDINVRCAEIMFSFHEIARDRNGAYVITEKSRDYNPCQNPPDTWLIIEKVWDELTESSGYGGEPSVWAWYINEYNCTKLVAACIFLIELSEDE